MKQNLELRNTDGHLIFGKGAKAIQHEFLFNKWCWNNWMSTCKKDELRS